jgi:hypothetical protein
VQVPPLLPLGVERLKLLAAWCMEPKAYIKGKVIMAASDAPTRVVWVKAGQCKLLSDPRAYEEEAFASFRERQVREKEGRVRERERERERVHPRRAPNSGQATEMAVHSAVVVRVPTHSRHLP